MASKKVSVLQRELNGSLLKTGTARMREDLLSTSVPIQKILLVYYRYAEREKFVTAIILYTVKCNHTSLSLE